MAAVYSSNLLRFSHSMKNLTKTLQRLISYQSKSALFVSNEVAQSTWSDGLNLDLGLDELLKNTQDLEDNLRRRNMAVNVDQLKKKYSEYSDLKEKLLTLNEDRRKVAQRMGELKNEKNTEIKKKLVTKGKNLKQQSKEVTKEFWKAEEDVMLHGLRLPNYLHKNVPDKDDILKNESNTELIEDKICHIQIATDKKLIQFCEYSEGSYYLCGDLAILEQTTLEYVRDYLDQHSYISMLTPDVFRTLVIEGCGIDFTSPAAVFRLQTDKSDGSGSKYENMMHMCGASLPSFVGFLTKSHIRKTNLPLRLYCQGRSYKPATEDGDKSLLDVQQESSVHVCIACRDEVEADTEFNNTIEHVWNLYSSFKLPIRLVNKSSINLLPAESLCYTIEVWLPSRQQYQTVAHVSRYDDYLSRRLSMFSSERGDKGGVKNLQKLNIVYGQVLSVPKFIAAVLENIDQDLNSSKIHYPKVLENYWLPKEL